MTTDTVTEAETLDSKSKPGLATLCIGNYLSSVRTTNSSPYSFSSKDAHCYSRFSNRRLVDTTTPNSQFRPALPGSQRRSLLRLCTRETAMAFKKKKLCRRRRPHHSSLLQISPYSNSIFHLCEPLAATNKLVCPDHRSATKVFFVGRTCTSPPTASTQRLLRTICPRTRTRQERRYRRRGGSLPSPPTTLDSCPAPTRRSLHRWLTHRLRFLRRRKRPRLPRRNYRATPQQRHGRRKRIWRKFSRSSTRSSRCTSRAIRRGTRA